MSNRLALVSMSSLFCVVSAAGAVIAHAKPSSSSPRVRAGELLVKVKPADTLDSVMGALGDRALAYETPERLLETDGGDWYLVKVEKGADTFALSKELVRSGEALESEPNFVYRAITSANEPSVEAAGPAPLPAPTLPNPPKADPLLGNLYGLTKIGAQAAWTSNKGNKSLLVADIDSGADYNHPDLINNIWRNPKEIAGDGIDNDRNGFVDDVLGWDFRDGDNLPFDDNGHGTHTTGTIGATGGNGIGVSGVAQKANIMVLRFLGGADGSGSSAGSIKAVDYAVKNGAKILSNSWGGGGYSQALFDAISKANTAGVLFVAAAGNEGANNDRTASYPANYNLPNVISVAATDSLDRLASFSNFGATQVDLAAPGVNTLSTYPNNRYVNLSGTSMATPHVSGAAYLLKSAYPQLTVAQLRALLLDSVLPVAGLTGKVVTGGRLDLARAFAIAKVRFGQPLP